MVGSTPVTVSAAPGLEGMATLTAIGLGLEVAPRPAAALLALFWFVGLFVRHSLFEARASRFLVRWFEGEGF